MLNYNPDVDKDDILILFNGDSIGMKCEKVEEQQLVKCENGKKIVEKSCAPTSTGSSGDSV